MNKDLVYIFDKIEQTRQVLGEIQGRFNMSYVIDGTKDSTQISVWSFSDSEIEPYTILWHEKTNSWWVVSHDKIERYMHDDGYLYVHTLELLGAIELFNARDLTDCGFNQNTYTIGEFLTRLINLSSLEYKGNNFAINSYVGNDFLNKKVDFVKTFENYTLLSAIREFLDGYNMSAKLTFSTYFQNNKTYLYGAILNIISKTGGNNLTQYESDDFNDTRETRTMDKNSFGTCVVSNAENVISSKEKIYPSVGSVQCSSTEYLIKPENALIRLPSKVFRGNWIKLINNRGLVTYGFLIGTESSPAPIDLFINPSSIDSINKGLDTFVSEIHTFSILAQKEDTFYIPFLNAFETVRERIINDIVKSATITLYNGNHITTDFNNSQGIIVQGENVPYLATVDFYSKDINAQQIRPYVFCSKEEKKLLPKEWQGISWERGSNIIDGFDGFEAVTGSRQLIVIHNFINTDLQVDAQRYSFFEFQNDYGTVSLTTGFIDRYGFHFGKVNYLATQDGEISFIINYIPMSDIKVKVDNTRNKKDIQLYNQNGKLIDNVAFSKLINSYSKEISSDTITKFMRYYDFSSVPKVGSLVVIDNENYVINNVSLDFTPNENTNEQFGYYIDCEITMCKHVSTKSLMVNPNTNIRDYGIPQNFNVKRKQVYRDYYELNYSLNSDNENDYYLEPQNVFAFGNSANEEINFVCVIKLDYATDIVGNLTYYYQLETTTYYMNKMVYVLCDFNDNNIIGYASQNVYSGFVVSRIFSGQTDTLNTPVSYVDENGQVLNVYIKYATNEQITKTYQVYQEQNGYGSDTSVSLYNYSVFIPQEIYDWLPYTFIIEEPNYKKDALEVPVFEYACQVEDTTEVLIGDNILTQYKDCIYFYHYKTGQNLTQDNTIDTSTLQFLESPIRIRMNSSANVEFDNTSFNCLKVDIYGYTTYNEETNEWSTYNHQDIPNNTDLAIFRHAYNTITGEEIVELMFIAKNIPQSSISNGGKTLTIAINHYKLN